MATPNLSQIVDAVEAEFEVQFIPASDEVYTDQLLVNLGEDEKDRPWQLQLIFLPHTDEIYYLQFFVLLPFPADEGAIVDLARLIMHINSKSPLIGFGLIEGENYLYFRTVVPCSNAELNNDLVLSTIWMIDHLLDVFSPIIEEVSHNYQTYEEASEAVEAAFTDSES